MLGGIARITKRQRNKQNENHKRPHRIDVDYHGHDFFRVRQRWQRRLGCRTFRRFLAVIFLVRQDWRLHFPKLRLGFVLLDTEVHRSQIHRTEDLHRTEDFRATCSCRAPQGLHATRSSKLLNDPCSPLRQARRHVCCAIVSFHSESKRQRQLVHQRQLQPLHRCQGRTAFDAARRDEVRCRLTRCI